jgi:hypothetical protein
MFGMGGWKMRRLAIHLCVFVFSLSFLGIISSTPAQAQMCVHYARMLTNFQIQGDAWTWWQGAVGHYQRGVRPAVGSVLVFRRTDRLESGHVSVVSRVIDNRTILVDHSWLEGSGLHRGMKVVDTSSGNNWSAVRVWYEPSDNLGLRTYPTFGFIYPHDAGPGDRSAPLTVAALGDRDDDGDNDRDGAHQPRSRIVLNHGGSEHLTVAFHPGHKPLMMLARAAAAPLAATGAHRPSTAPVESSAAPGAIPSHKPGAHAHGGAQVADASHVRGHDGLEIGD